MIARREASARPGSCGDANSAHFRRASGRDPVAGRVAARDENQHGKPEAVALKAPRASGGRAVLRDRRPTRGRPWSAAAVRTEFRRHAAEAGVRRRFAPHQLRHAHAVELAREGVSLNVIQRQLGHVNLGTTSIYLQGIDIEEIISTVHARRAPMMSATAGLQL